MQAKPHCLDWEAFPLCDHAAWVLAAGDMDRWSWRAEGHPGSLLGYEYMCSPAFPGAAQHSRVQPLLSPQGKKFLKSKPHATH